jgi:hypothetical protein
VSSRSNADQQDQPSSRRRVLLTGGAAGLAAVAGSVLGGAAPASAQALGPSITDWLNVVSDFSADNSGATDAWSDINQALTAAATVTTGSNPNGTAVVYMPVGTYKVTKPLTIPPQVMLLGAMPAGTGVAMSLPMPPNLLPTDYAGTIIKASPGAWAQTTAAGVIYVNGNGTTIYKPSVANLWIDGSSVTGTTLHGISAYGGAFHGVVSGVGVWNVCGSGMNFQPDSSGNRSDGWTIRDCVVQTWGSGAATDYGIYWHGQDTQFVNVHVQAIQAASGGGACWYVDNGDNCRWVACRGDQSNDSGWVFNSFPKGGSPGASSTLVGCGTENNQNYGISLINDSAEGTEQRTPVIAIACSFDFDGRSGSGAGVSVQGVNALDLIGCNITTNGPNGNVGPQHGLVTATPGMPQKVRAIGGTWNCIGTSLVQDGAGMGPAGGLSIDVHAVTGGPWSSGSTLAPYKNGIATTPPPVTTPNVPSSGGQVQNETGCDVAVYITGGDVLAITVNDTAVLNSSPATVYLPAGASIGWIYSGTTVPSWVWQAV